MIFVFLSGMLGFFVFDAYRVRKTYVKTQVIEITFGSLLGMLVHVFVYVACGVLGTFISLDVLMSCCSNTPFAFDGSVVAGSMMRAFALGLAGPAGISRGRVEFGTDKPVAVGARKGKPSMQVDDLSKIKTTLRNYFDILLMR